MRYVALLGALFQTLPATAQSLPVVTDTSPLFTVTASAVYDSNVARSSENLANLRGIVQEDEIYSPTAQLNLARIWGSGAAFIKASAGYDFYRNNTILNREELDVHTGVNQKLETCFSTLEGIYTRQQSDLDQLTVAVTKNTESLSSASLSVVCDWGSRVSWSLSAAPTWAQNSAILLKASDNRSVPVIGEVRYDFSTFGKISIFGEYVDATYPYRAVQLDSSFVADGYNLYSGGVRFKRDLGTRLTATLQLSVISLRPRVPEDLAFSGAGYSAAVTYQFTPRLDAEVFIEKAANPANRIDTTYSVDQTYRASLGYKLGVRTRLSFDGQIVDFHYFGAKIQRGIDPIKQSIGSINAKLGYTLRPNLSIALTAMQEHGSADIEGYGYDDSRAELSLSAAF